MRERGRIFIQAECLKVARRQPGCGVLQSVLIAPISSEAGGPNWEIVSFLPAPLAVAADRRGRFSNNSKQGDC